MFGNQLLYEHISDSGEPLSFVFFKRIRPTSEVTTFAESAIYKMHITLQLKEKIYHIK